MMEDKKYYTPTIQDLRVGYECEVRWHYIGSNPFWQRTVLEEITVEGNSGIIYDVIDIGRTLRTKYLDKDDIEICEWIWNERQGWFTYGDNDDWLMNTGSTLPLWLNLWNDDTGAAYHGECKSINELRKLMEWLNIKQI